MKKIIKYSFYGLIYVVIIIFLALMFVVTAKANIIKLNNGIEPYQVVKIQLSSLMKNNDPKKNYGIKQTWEFAHPNNQKYTGPLDRFTVMLQSQPYKMLLNHINHKIVEVQMTNSVALYRVVILDINKVYYQLNWQVEKYVKNDYLKGC